MFLYQRYYIISISADCKGSNFSSSTIGTDDLILPISSKNGLLVVI